jgi:hypothetical protein
MTTRTKTVVNPHARRRTKKPVVRVINMTYVHRSTLRALVDFEFGGLRVNGLQVHVFHPGGAEVIWPECGRNYTHMGRPATPEVQDLVETAILAEFWGVER